MLNNEDAIMHVWLPETSRPLHFIRKWDTRFMERLKIVHRAKQPSTSGKNLSRHYLDQDIITP